MAQQQENHQQEQKKEANLVCPQYIVITPCDLTSWRKLEQEIKVLFANYTQERCIHFLEEKYQARGINNIRFIKRITASFFWVSVMQYMLEEMQSKTSIISGVLNVLVKNQNTIVKLTRNQIFVVMSHLFLGTFPSQLYKKDLSFSKLAFLGDNQDETTCGQITLLRLNKLKAIVKYFANYCNQVFKKTPQEKAAFENQLVIFQRYSVSEGQFSKVKMNNIKFCEVNPKIGQFYLENKQINGISINNITNFYSNREQFDIPGHAVFDNELNIEQKIFLTHPQMFVLPVIMHEGLSQYESIIIHGALKITQMDEISRQSIFDFSKVAYKDPSSRSTVDNFRVTSFMFTRRCTFKRKQIYNLVPDINKIYSGLKGCLLLHKDNQRLVSGYFYSKNRKSQMPWDMKFLVDWIGASLAGFKNLDYYVEDNYKVIDIKILAKQLQNYTLQDIANVLESYYILKMEEKAKIGLMEFFKYFAL